MPMLDYRCEQCGHTFAELVFSGKEDQVQCEKCGSKQLRRVYEGRCLFGSTASSGGKGGCSASSCQGCSGCH